MGQTILSTTAHPKILQNKITKLEGQKEYAEELGLWTEDLENQLQEAKKQHEDLMSGESILSTKPDEGGITDIEEEGGGWKWLEGIKSLNPFRKETGGESFAGTDKNATSIVLDLAKTWGVNKAIQIATSQYGIPYQAVVLALNTPMGQYAVQDASTMFGNIKNALIPTGQGGYSYPTVGDSGAGPATTINNQGIMAAGQQALGQTPAQVAAQVAASQATQQGNYQAPTMSQQQMVQEAQQTGGTVNPHEATQAAWTPPPPRGPNLVNRAQGGIVSINHLTRRI